MGGIIGGSQFDCTMITENKLLNATCRHTAVPGTCTTTAVHEHVHTCIHIIYTLHTFIYMYVYTYYIHTCMSCMKLHMTYMYILVLVLVLVSTCGTYAVHVVYIHDIRVHMYVMYRTHTSINMCGHVYYIRTCMYSM